MNIHKINPDRKVRVSPYYTSSGSAHNRFRNWQKLFDITSGLDMEITYGQVRMILLTLYQGDKVLAGGGRSDLLRYGCIELVEEE